MIESTSIKDLIHKLYSEDMVSYVQIRPGGVKLANAQITPVIEGEVLSLSFAKTRAEKYQPLGRSLHGIHALNADYTCSSCTLLMNCTPQIRLDMMHSSVLLRFLLSDTSFRNFMLFLSTRPKQKTPLNAARMTIKILNRGRWGKAKFSLNPLTSRI